MYSYLEEDSVSFFAVKYGLTGQYFADIFLLTDCKQY